ncbi:MAG TPA: flavin reductase [Xanthobacteraceae bacterium]|nr:flavin reductase [Xanthobacteraceae bacterium]
MTDLPSKQALSSAQPVSPDDFRHALGQFPTGVTVVTATHDGQPVGMTANSFASVSLQPPLVLWSVATSAFSHDAFVAADAYAVHFLGTDHFHYAARFAGRGSPKFDGVNHQPGITGAPLLDGLAPILECRTWARYPGGDHTILVGEVVRIVTRTHDPLVFHSGQMRRIDSSPFASRMPELAAGSFANTYLAYLLARASFLVSSAFHATLPQWDLSVSEWRVLACLMDAEGLSVGELAAMALMKQPALTKILDRMERDGLVVRKMAAADRRRVLIHLTAAGRSRAKPVLRAAKAHETELLATFKPEERRMIKEALHLLIDGHAAETARKSR